MAVQRKIWLVNQLDRRLVPFRSGKYNELTGLLHADREIEIANPTAITRPPKQLPYYKRDTRMQPDGSSHMPEGTDRSKGAEYSRAHDQYFRQVVQDAAQAEAVPVIFANPHEFTKGAYVALAEIYPDLQLPMADAHLDVGSNSFVSGGFLREPLNKGVIPPQNLQIFGSNVFAYANRAGQRREIVVNSDLLAQLPDWVIDIALRDRRGHVPDIGQDVLFLAMTETAKIVQPDKWDEASIDKELSNPENIMPFFQKMVLVWDRIYLYKKGVWVDHDQPNKTVDYQGKPLLFSFDTDVSLFLGSRLDQVMQNLDASLKTGWLVGLHVAEVETDLTRWSAKQIYQVMRRALLNGRPA